ncbi:MAG: hypothetical protein ACLSAP_10785 [Oscillospiraceae bacterium]
MILAGSMNCLRGFPGLKNLEFLFVYHNKDSFIIEKVSGSKPKPIVTISKDKIISIDLLLPETLDYQCKSMITNVILGEVLFGSAHLFMDNKWTLGKVEFSPVKIILCIAYKGEMEEEIETIYFTRGIGYCEKMYKKLMEAWKAPPEYYRVYPEGEAEESTYRYMGEY